eukprot:TRINITY_DN238_c0_g1_i2.p1 TRINITY_DN238_c0_g1~~TRINITY_DN238_c0_g1_i2.p1  ORF type:complete len:823 (-),score=89.00 TRINITY_DN238_c0_g1_i2:5026-7494(-)
MSQLSFAPAPNPPEKTQKPSPHAHTFISLYNEYEIIGISIYIPSLCLLKIGQIPESVGDYEHIAGTILSYEPDVLIVQKNFKSALLNTIKDLLPSNTKVVQLKGISFSYEQTVNKLKSNIDSFFCPDKEEENNDKSQPLYSLGSCVRIRNFIELDKKQSISALGGLLSYLETISSDNKIKIKAVDEIASSGRVMISYKSLRDLQVFSEDLHPSLIKGKGRSKEGLSLFSLLDFTATVQGRHKLQHLLMSPLTDLTRICERHKVIQFFLDMNDPEILEEIISLLRHVAELEKIVTKFALAIHSPADWIKLYRSVLYGLRVLCILKEQKNASLANYRNILFTEMERLDVETLSELEEVITFAIDMDESKRQQRIYIKPGISEELDQLRYQYANLGEFLTKVAASIYTVVPHDKFPFLSQFYLTYLPLLGYMLAVPRNESLTEYMQKVSPATDEALAQILMNELSEWEYVFSSEEALYFRNEITKTLDEEVGDLHGSIVDIEQKILREIENKVIEKSDELCTLSYLLGDLDAMFSLFLASKEYSLVRPEIVEEPVIEIVEGRHLLTEQITTPFIPNDCRLELDKRVALVSGPNSSGKSVYIKQVGLIIILALAGGYVPCKSARIGKFSKILTKFPGREAVGSGMSFFTKELTEINTILKQCDGTTLLIIDEFSRGTRQIDGIALFGSLVTALSNSEVFRKVKLELKCKPTTLPCTLATTHCYELYQFKLLSFSKIELLQMQIVVTPKTSEKQESENVVCLHKVVPGICSDSRPMYAALLAKLYKYVVKRAYLVENYFGEQIMHPLHLCIAETKKRYIEIIKEFST